MTIKNKNPRICPNCNSDSTVYETRIIDGQLIRRRKCKKCKLHWKTLEIFVEDFMNDADSI